MKLTLYNIDELIKEKSKGKEKAFYSNQECAIILMDNIIMVAYFDCRFNTYKSIDDTIMIELLAGDAGTDESSPYDFTEMSIKEIVETAPTSEIDADEFFHKKDLNMEEKNKYIALLETLVDVAENPSNLI